MYNGISDELVDAGFADKLSTPVWMNSTGEEVSIEDSFRCKVAHNTKHSDYVLVLDEVRGNTNQKGDENIGGESIMCERGKTPHKKSTQRINITQ